MKYDIEEKRIPDDNSEAEAFAADTSDMHEVDENEAHGDIDKLRALVYNSAIKMIRGFENAGIYDTHGSAACSEALKRLRELKDFKYYIGFAGEQSSGKSTVINSIIEYPLMSTCKLATTCVGVELTYSKDIHMTVVDEDTFDTVLDIDCSRLSENQFLKLMEYALAVLRVSTIENIQYFTDKDIFNDQIELEDLDMDHRNPKHAAVLMMILLTVYVGQNASKLSQDMETAIRLREETMKAFGLSENTINYSVYITWDNNYLKNGVVVTDLPGLGADAEKKEIDGRILRGHTDITLAAVKMNDTIVTIVDPDIRAEGMDALKEMLSSERMKEIVFRGERVIPVLNKCDRFNGENEKKNSINKFIAMLSAYGVIKSPDEINQYSAIFGEYKYSEFPIRRKLFYINNRKLFKMLPDEQVEALLQEEYAGSGIDRLKDYLLKSHIERFKCSRVHSVIFAIRLLAQDTVVSLESVAKNYELLQKLAGDTIVTITSSFEQAAQAPVNDALKELNGTDIKSEAVRKMLNSIPLIYSRAFERALEEYKEKNLKIADKFETNLFGEAQITTKAQNIDARYELLTSCSRLSIDLQEVNDNFSVMLHTISENIKEMMLKAIMHIDELKRKIPESIQQTIRDFENDSRSEQIMEPVKMLGKSLTELADSKLMRANETIEHIPKRIEAIANEIVDQIITFNMEITRDYSASITKEVTSLIHKGLLAKKREYIRINGTNGLKDRLSSLKLSSNDRDIIEDKIIRIGVENITNNTEAWFNEARNELVSTFTEINDTINKVIKDTVSQLGDNAEENQKNYELMQQKIRLLKEGFEAFRDAVQDQIDLSTEIADESNLKRYKGNIFSGVLEGR